MTDHELLEAAACAAGLPFTMTDDRGWFRVRSHPSCEWELWNPLNDDSDALSLAVKLRISLTMRAEGCMASDLYLIDAYERYGSDPISAARRAIVLVAAQIGPEKRPQDIARGL